MSDGYRSASVGRLFSTCRSVLRVLPCTGLAHVRQVRTSCLVERAKQQLLLFASLSYRERLLEMANKEKHEIIGNREDSHRSMTRSRLAPRFSIQGAFEPHRR
jgi:hypothetical protein